MKLEEIAIEASKLSEEERASLASRRMREAEGDPTVWINFEEFIAGLKHQKDHA